MTSPSDCAIHLGYEIGPGAAVAIPRRHMVITGQTQEAGKTTALEALLHRSNARALVFVTKRGEGAFADAPLIRPFFREQTDWAYVASILEASRGEKLKFERAWIIRASKGARTLADVQHNVRRAMEKARGMSADVYLTLDAYLDAVVPQIAAVRWASSVELEEDGAVAMDLVGLNLEMQHLVIRSSIAWVQEHAHNTIVVVPEAWRFLPQGRGTPVKLAAETFIRQTAALGNYLWLDSQDIAGVDKTILKSVPVWILGVQRESNEVKRTLDQIPAGIKKPKAEEIATLGLGQFFACFGRQITKVYVQPAWCLDGIARGVAMGEVPMLPSPPARAPKKEEIVTEAEARALRERADRLERENAQLRERLDSLERAAPPPAPASAPIRSAQPMAHAPAQRIARPAPVPGEDGDERPGAITLFADRDKEWFFQEIKGRLAAEAPALLKLLTIKPELIVEVERKTLTIDGATPKGRVARLLAEGFFRERRTQGETRAELARSGSDTNSGRISTIFGELLSDGFLRKDSGDRYVEVEGMKARIVESFPG